MECVRPASDRMAKIRFSKRKVGAISLHVAEAGPDSGPAVILLHGFPEFWFGWRHQIDALADAGFHVIVPDQRGYNLSDKPKAIEDYDLDPLARDITGLADVLGIEQYALVGHDWGAGVAWWIAQQNPKGLRRLAIMNAPHPALWRRAMGADPVQRKLSRYVRLLGVPVLPEMLVRAGRYKSLSDAISESTRPMSDDERNEYRKAWSQVGALTGMINWYRAILRRRFDAPPASNIGVPTQIIWGARDRYASLSLAEPSKALCVRANLIVFDEATHWVQHDEALRVNTMLLEFLK
jgi:pimeloyl-ACP methyl ester carboxylesterase